MSDKYVYYIDVSIVAKYCELLAEEQFSSLHVFASYIFLYVAVYI